MMDSGENPEKGPDREEEMFGFDGAEKTPREDSPKTPEKPPKRKSFRSKEDAAAKKHGGKPADPKTPVQISKPSPETETPKTESPKKKNLFEKIKLPAIPKLPPLPKLPKLPEFPAKAKNEPPTVERPSPRIEAPAESVGTKFRGFLGPLLALPSGIWGMMRSNFPPGVQNFFSKFGKWIGMAVVLGIIAMAVKSCFFQPKDKQALKDFVSEQKEAKQMDVPVKGFKIARFNFEDSLNVLGTVKGALEFKLSFEVPGVISSINYREGERYEEGALLMSLRQDDILLRLKRAQAAMKKTQTDVEIAKEKVTEHEKLYAMGAIPKATLDKVKLEHEGASYESEAARLEMKAHEAMLEKSNLYSPSAGMIGELNVEEGETITPNTLLGTHIMTEFVYSEFGIVERDVKKIALGQKARIFVDAYPDKTFEGVIENVAPVVAGTSRTATAKVRLENPDRLLLPGMFCRIRVLLYSKKNTLVVPTDSIQGSEGDQWVFVINPETSTAEKRAITIGYTRPDYSQVDAGIAEGEIVAISSIEQLEQGKKVRLLETQEAEV